MTTVVKEFKSSIRWWDGLWGGGHTRQTDPMTNGWIARLTSHGSRVLLIGQRGVMGCASVMQLPDGRIDVALYYETPETILANLKATNKCGGDPGFQQVNDTPGWGLHVIKWIERMRS